MVETLQCCNPRLFSKTSFLLKHFNILSVLSLYLDTPGFKSRAEHPAGGIRSLGIYSAF